MPDTRSYVDLHTHSTASDGQLPPAALVRAAARAGLCALALTDHDTISGLPEAAAEAKAAGIRFIPGVEIEIDRSCLKEPARGEFHLLALGLERPRAGFLRLMERLARRRRRRNREIIRLMREAGWDASYEEVCAIAGSANAGRPHFAEYLTRLKAARSPDDAFERFLGVGKSLYVPKKGAALTTALKTIRESGALSIFAHPTSLYMSLSRFPALFARLAAAGLDGVEVWHPIATPRTCARLLAMARPLGLRVSGGSDYHGDSHPARRLGHAAGGEKIPLSVLEELFDKKKAPAPPP